MEEMLGTMPSAGPATTVHREPKPAAEVSAVRHAEARRVATCDFANRIARVSVAHYHAHVPPHFVQAQPQTCLATIVAHYAAADSASDEMTCDTAATSNNLVVLAMGVGTKFLSDPVLMKAVSEEDHGEKYGERVRDCHAEVLARRAFRRYLSNGIYHDVSSTKPPRTTTERHTNGDFILERCRPNHDSAGSSKIRYQLKANITLHFYCSSTPCGNSTLKQFCTLQREVYQDGLARDEWPCAAATHETIPGHSIAMGQFALLLKKDHALQVKESETIRPRDRISKRQNLNAKQRAWPVHCQTKWCPPGTTTVWSNLGRLHTCSDKLARWNYLGHQGSLLASLLDEPLYPSTLTVGRKFSAATCRRAVCCRLATAKSCPASTVVAAKAMTDPLRGDSSSIADQVDSETHSAHHDSNGPSFALHHPTVMGTSVYMDETGVVDTSETTTGQHVRFASFQSWASWKRTHHDTHVVECLDGSTGWRVHIDGRVMDDDAPQARRSDISTLSLTQTYLDIQRAMIRSPARSGSNPGGESVGKHSDMVPLTLLELRRLKMDVSGTYEQAKQWLLQQHPVMRDWNRRQEYAMEQSEE
jgi:Adenosine-deaminase (editase) domain